MCSVTSIQLEMVYLPFRVVRYEQNKRARRGLCTVLNTSTAQHRRADKVTVAAENGVVAMDTPWRSQKYLWRNTPIVSRTPILRNIITGGDITGGFCLGAGFPSCHKSIYRVSEDNPLVCPNGC
jgi:hypothetical protein